MAARLRRAADLAEADLDDPDAMLPSYMPWEHLAAVYAPIVAPLVAPFVFGLLDEGRRYRRLAREMAEVRFVLLESAAGYALFERKEGDTLGRVAMLWLTLGELITDSGLSEEAADAAIDKWEAEEARLRAEAVRRARAARAGA